MRLKYILSTIFIIVIVIIGGAFFLLNNINVEPVRVFIQDEVKKQTGRDLIIQGDIEWAFSLSPTIVVHNVSLSNPAGFSQKEMAIIELFELNLDLLPLLHKEIVINSFTLDKVNIFLEKNTQGQGNWSFATSESKPNNGVTPEITLKEDAPIRVPTIEKVDIQNLSFVYKDAVAKKEQNVFIKKLTAKAQNNLSPVELSLESNINDIPVVLNGKVGSINSIIEAKPIEINLDGAINNTKVIVDGKIANLKLFQGINANVEISGDNLNDLASLASIKNIQNVPFDIKTTFSDPSGTYNFDPLKIRLDDMDVTGKLMFLKEEIRSKIKGGLQISKLDLDKVLSKSNASSDISAKSSESKGNVIPNDPIDFSALSSIDAELQLAIGQFIYSSQEFKNISAGVNLNNGRLVLNPFKTNAGNGTIDANLVLESKNQPNLSLVLNTSNIDSHFFSELIHSPGLLKDGKITIKSNLKGQGNSVKNILASSNGYLNFYIDKGSMNNNFLRIILADLIKLISSGNSESSTLNCAASHIDFTQGIAETKAAVIDTPSAIIVANGQVNLATEKLSMHVESSPKTATLAALAVPMNITGTLSSPTVLPDPLRTATDVAGKVIKGVTGGVGGALSILGFNPNAAANLNQNPNAVCNQALAMTKNSQPQPNSSINPVDNIIDNTGKTLEDIGEGIKGLFQ
ncbi:MAG: AsmA family protein [Alphaproteobacteria bacterium]|nr:AsmA family protein [Alphaproteobacteria bacterium]